MANLLILGQICMINIVLAGDNAIVIGMAARNVPENIRKKVIMYGTLGAVVIRVVATLGVVYLLETPGLHFVGGIVLLYIAYKLLCTGDGDCANMPEKSRLTDAIKTIIIADMATGLDNVIAVAGAANGHFWLVMIGLALSIPLVVFGSTVIVKILDRFPFALFIGSLLIIYTGVEMIFNEHFIESIIELPAWSKWAITLPLSYLTAQVAGYDLMGAFSSKLSPVPIEIEMEQENIQQ